MRVISGKAKGRKLKIVPGETTRPVMDRIKENFFNILGDWVRDTRWLDLFAGTGQIGIEALSREAASVVFTDKARAAIRIIHDNLKTTRLDEDATVVQTDAFAYLQRVRQGLVPRFDLIYVAPPQYLGLWVDIMKMLDEDPAAFLEPDGLVVIQIHPKEYNDEQFQRLFLTDKRKYGNTLLCFYEMEAVDEEPA